MSDYCTSVLNVQLLTAFRKASFRDFSSSVELLAVKFSDSLYCLDFFPGAVVYADVNGLFISVDFGIHFKFFTYQLGYNG